MRSAEDNLFVREQRRKKDVILPPEKLGKDEVFKAKRGWDKKLSVCLRALRRTTFCVTPSIHGHIYLIAELRSDVTGRV